MESNHQPSLAGTAFKAACAPCAPSSVVGAAGIEPATSCSQSKRATAALRPDDWLLATLSARALVRMRLGGCAPSAANTEAHRQGIPKRLLTVPGWPQLLPPLRPSADGCRILRPGGLLCWPRYFPGVVMVQRLRPLCLRVAPWLHRPGRVFRLPAAGLYFANIEAPCFGCDP